jgi:hypothetical protein
MEIEYLWGSRISWKLTTHFGLICSILRQSKWDLYMKYGAGAGLPPRNSVSFCHYLSINPPSPFSSYHKDKPANPEGLQAKRFVWDTGKYWKEKYFHFAFTLSRKLKCSVFIIVCCYEGNCVAVNVSVFYVYWFENVILTWRNYRLKLLQIIGK